MLFYKIEGMLEGNTFSEDGAIRRQAAKEFQGKQELFAKKLQGKCYLSISQIRDGRITLAAVSREEYNILARCREFFQETDIVSQTSPPRRSPTACCAPCFPAPSGTAFWRTTRTCTRCSTSASCSTTPTISTRPCCRAAFPWRSRRGRQPNCFARTPSIRSWSASTRGPRCWWEAATLSTTCWCAARGKPETGRWSCSSPPCIRTGASTASGPPGRLTTTTTGWTGTCWTACTRPPAAGPWC